MVEVTTSERADAHRPAAGYEALSTGQGTPQIHVHHVARDVFGNGIAIRSYGEIKIAAGEYVWAKELLMNTLQVLVLTPEIGTNNGLGYMAQKAIWHKGECKGRKVPKNSKMRKNRVMLQGRRHLLSQTIIMPLLMSTTTHRTSKVQALVQRFNQTEWD